ncbi:MAG: sulfatase-like hydrolase/transferase [Lentisphaeria bacterium]
MELRPNVPASITKDAQKLAQGYYGLITLLDQQFGRIQETLKELGVAEDTIIVYTSDHGDMLPVITCSISRCPMKNPLPCRSSLLGRNI